MRGVCGVHADVRMRKVVRKKTIRLEKERQFEWSKKVAKNGEKNMMTQV